MRKMHLMPWIYQSLNALPFRIKKSITVYFRLIAILVFTLFAIAGIFRSATYSKFQLADRVRLHNDVELRRALAEQAQLLHNIPFNQTLYKCAREKWPSDSLEGHRLKALHSAIVYLTNISSSLVPDVFNSKDLHSRKFVCAVYQTEGLYERVAVEGVWRNASRHTSDSVTLVTQLSVEKLNMLSLLADSWPGSISASLHVNTTQLHQLCQLFAIHSKLLAKPNLDIHIVLKRGLLYPVNLLRQIALDAAMTEYVFLVDVDFIPDPGLYNAVQGYITGGYIGDKNALVVPCFQFNWSPGSAFPQTKKDLLDYWDVDMVQPFISCGFIPGEKPTNYTKWREVNEPYKVERFQDGYEPYIIAKKTGLPRYNLKFLGRIRDKISHLFHIYALGYSFTVIPSNFIVHMPHSQQCDVPYNLCAFEYYKIFYEEIKQRYPEIVSTKDLLPDNRSIRSTKPPKGRRKS